jgi:stearoyl-CoA desaturase (delta-9 desaturase)
VKLRGLSLKNYTTVSGLFIVGYHLALLIGLPFYFYYAPPGRNLIIATVILLFLSEIGIGAAYHRFYSHRGFSLAKPVEAVLLFLATLAIQGSALRWSFEHRLHHTFVDTDDDPYSIKKGFWYAHVLWLFEPARPIEDRRVPDLLGNKLVMFQHKHFGWLSIGSNFVVCGLIGWAVGDFLGAFVLAWWTRLLVSHHLTWFINSLAHCWGEQTYSKEHTARDNFILAFLTVGEGYHNYHHTFASDYRNGVRWFHFDPTKWTIWTLSKLGLASNLKRFNRITIRKRLLVEDKRLLLKTLTAQAHTKKLELEQRVYQLADAIYGKLNQLAKMADEHRKLRKQHADRGAVRESRARLAALKRSLKRDWRSWSQLCGAVLDGSAQPA